MDFAPHDVRAHVVERKAVYSFIVNGKKLKLDATRLYAVWQAWIRRFSLVLGLIVS